MNKRIEYITSRECEAVEGGAWCVIESTPDADIAISQHETETEANCAAWSAAKGWHNVSEQERREMQKKVIDTLLKRV
jgi:hypothetical protein